MRLRIWHKMIIGITVPSLIAIIGGLFAYGYINDIENREGYERIADSLKEQVFEVRRNEKIFFYFKNAEYLDNLHNAISVLKGSFNNISAKTIEEIGEEDFSKLQDYIQKYPDLINVLYENYQKETMITEKVRAEGRELEAFAAKNNNSKDISTNFVLHLRLLEKNYMLFRDKKSYNGLNSTLSQIKNIIPFCYECTPYLDAVHDLFVNHKNSDSLVNKIQTIGKRLEEITGIMSIRERERIRSFLTKTKRLMLIALILLCTLGPLLVYKTAGYIVAPIKRLAEITNKIAEGDMTVRAPIREHDETYALATSFNMMLDNLQMTHASLESSLDLLHEKQAQLVDSEKRASLGLLVSGVAHELNNPLYNISLTAEGMRDGLNDFSKDEMSEYIEDLITQGKRARNIIHDLLDFARARKSTEMEKRNIVNVVRESINLVSNQIRMNNIELKEDITDADIFITGNRSKLEQILVSIFTNAIQVMKGRGILNVSVKLDSDEKNVIIRISDTGLGIAQKDIKHVFEPFFTTKPVGEGTGLGLSVCHSLVLEHKGEIYAESAMGKGTTFVITFPLFEEMA